MTLEIRAGREPFTQNASPRSHNSGAAAAQERELFVVHESEPGVVLWQLLNFRNVTLAQLQSAA